MFSQRLLYIIERITDILKLEEEREVVCPDAERKRIPIFRSKIRKQRIIKSVQELHEELLRFVEYVKNVEEGHDEQQHDHDRFYRELGVIADSCDNILTCVISDDDKDVIFNVCDGLKSILNCVVGDDITSRIYRLVKWIRKSHHLLPSGPTYYFDTGGNTNISGQQIIQSTNIYIDPTHSRSPMINRISRPKTYGEYPDSDLVGFEHEIQTLLDQLTQENETRVVGIVGMGGLGKTTLAKHIFHHPQINTKFSCRVWVCISESWDKTSILNEICRQVTRIPEATTMDYEQAIRLLFKHLRRQSYLIVLDDMWSIDAWYDISRAFLPWSCGNKVVVTSRNRAITQRLDCTVFIVEPKPLNDKESWELFKKKAFLPNESISRVLLQLGEKMVEECEGLPLAIVALAGVLGIDKRPCNWERVSKTLSQNILKEKNQSTQGVVKEVLALSYRELPPHLKQCVLYLRLFPEDYKINARSLMKMWIGEGLISTNEESTAEEYIDEIVQRYIVKVVKTNFMGQVVRIRIHDLIRQMFVDIDKERGFFRDSLRLDSNTALYGDEQSSNFSSRSWSERPAVDRIYFLEQSSDIRSIIFLNNLDLLKSVLQSMFVRFRLLRMLVLHDNYISGIEIPEEIGNLIHLRYLELGGGVKRLPRSIGNLRYIQTLNMRYIRWETGAEINWCKLKELRHLYLPYDFRASIDMENLILARLEKLKTLWNVRGGRWMLLGLTKLSVLLEELRVSCISSGEQLQGVFRTPSITSNNLRTLELGWFSEYGNVKLRDMHILRECKSLKKLKLCGQIQASTDIMFPPNLIKLDMVHTCLENGEMMNIISNSCPDLKILKLGFKSFLGEELVCKANSFPQLVKLKLEILPGLMLWIIESTAMLSLHYLTIKQCTHLTVTPYGWTRISQIPQLTIQHCPHLDSEMYLK